VVGYSDALGNTAVHATIWNGNTLTDLGIQFEGYSFAYGINNSGQVAGYGTFAHNGEPHATIWNGITPTDLGTQVAGYSSFATAINDSGQVVGVSYSNHATIWNGNIATDLGTLPGGIYSYAAAINNSGPQGISVTSNIFHRMAINLPMLRSMNRAIL
jgi:probable HAF family extracellular repeat protein